MRVIQQVHGKPWPMVRGWYGACTQLFFHLQQVGYLMRDQYKIMDSVLGLQAPEIEAAWDLVGQLDKKITKEHSTS